MTTEMDINSVSQITESDHGAAVTTEMHLTTTDQITESPLETSNPQMTDAQRSHSLTEVHVSTGHGDASETTQSQKTTEELHTQASDLPPQEVDLITRILLIFSYCLQFFSFHLHSVLLKILHRATSLLKF